jgi:hypothetical protein
MTRLSLRSKDGFSVGNNVNPLFKVGDLNIFVVLNAFNQANNSTEGIVWLRCNGATYNRSDYPLLWQVLANAGGSLTTSTTFNVPNLQSRFLVGDSTMSNTSGVNTNTAVLVAGFNSNTALTTGNSGDMTHYHNTGDISLNHQHNWGNAHNDGNPTNVAGGSGNVTNAAGQSHNHTTTVGGATGNVNTGHLHGTNNSSSGYDHSHSLNHSHAYSPPPYVEFIFGIKAR